MESQVEQYADGLKPLRKSRNGFIELCRFVFAMGIVSHHSQFLTNDLNEVPMLGGYISVEFFFILTGYFMYSSYKNSAFSTGQNRSAVYQIYAKFKRFYPYFLVTWCTVFVLKHIESGSIRIGTLLWDFISGIPQLLFLQCTGLAGGGYAYNGPTWFVSALLLGMLIVYFLMYAGERYFATAIAPALSLICYGLVVIINGSLGSVHEWVFFLQAGSLRAIGGLCLGSFCCHVVDSIPTHRLTRLGNVVFSFCQLGLIMLSLFLMVRTHGYTDVIQIILFSLLIIISFTEETTLNQLCNAKMFFALGKFSMIIFVTQHIAYCSPALLFYPETWAWRYDMYIAYVLLFSLLNYLIVENVRRWHIFQRMKRCFFKQSDE